MGVDAGWLTAPLSEAVGRLQTCHRPRLHAQGPTGPCAGQACGAAPPVQGRSAVRGGPKLSSLALLPLLLLKIMPPLPTLGRGPATSGTPDGSGTGKALAWALFQQPGLWAFAAITSASGQVHAALPAQRARDSARHRSAAPGGLAHTCLCGLSAQQRVSLQGLGHLEHVSGPQLVWSRSLRATGLPSRGPWASHSHAFLATEVCIPPRDWSVSTPHPFHCHDKGSLGPLPVPLVLLGSVSSICHITRGS